MTALRCEGVCVSFGGFHALTDVTLGFRPGRITSIIGPNGAGKTTLINALSGSLRPTSGTIRIGEDTVNAVSPAGRVRMGLGRSFQTINVFPDLSVRENLELAAQARAFRIQPFWRKAHGIRALSEAADRILDLVGLDALADRTADTLSHGDQRALELGLTLIGEPKILLLDEPLAGVGHGGIVRMEELIRKIAADRTVILVEHNMDVVMGLSDEVVVLAQGKVLGQGSPAEIQSNSDVRAAYLGDPV